jgi:hypothetical protein
MGGDEMFQWTPATEALVLSLVTTHSSREIARRLGCDKTTVTRFLLPRGVNARRAYPPITPAQRARVLFLSELEDYKGTFTNAHIALVVGVSASTVTTILGPTNVAGELDWSGYANAAMDETFQTRLNAQHPGRYYEDDPHYLTEYPDDELPQAPRARTIDPAYLPEETARYKVDQSHTIPRPITLATGRVWRELSKLPSSYYDEPFDQELADNDNELPMFAMAA